MRIRQIYKNIAREYANTLIKNKSVVGIVFLDKPIVDKEDDIDVVVFVKNNVKTPRGERIYNGYDIDESVIDILYAKKTSWSQETRAALKNAAVLYDEKNKIRNLLKNKLIFTGREREDIIVSSIFHLIWMGIHDKHRWKDYKIPYYSRDLWIKRGGIPSAEIVLDYGIDLLMNILFAYNKEFIPDQRSKLCDSYNLRWLPKNYKRRMNKLIVTKKISKKDFERRYSIFQSLLEETVNKLKRDKILPKRMYHYFLKHDPFYSLHPKL